ncbi:MAG: carbamoyl phosphate synthase small subunit, partial [Myxococcaceae bacterium]|nr:carbamoyl phosphate synthase small subunit [Myxococcaceae bacterium]
MTTLGKDAILALADGTVFKGQAFGAATQILGEVVFNTSMYGYQEILTDPSYVGQILTFSYPHIGNVGTNPDDEESSRPHAVGLVVRALSEASNWRSKESLDQYLVRWGIPGIQGLDTRQLVRHLRTHGSQMGILSSDGTSAKALVEKAASAHGMEGLDLATGISVKEPFEWTKCTPDPLNATPAAQTTGKYKVVAIDYGLKNAMIQFLC